MNYLRKLYELLVLGNQKAITGFVLAAVAVHLATVGISLEMTVGEALTSLTSGLLNAAGVWLKANRD